MRSARLHDFRPCIVLALALLGGCGGGGSGVSSTTPPASSPTPSPTPTPPPIPTTGLVDLTGTTSLEASAVTLDLHAAYYNGQLIGNALSATKHAITITYDPVQDSYQLSMPDRTASFGASDLKSKASDGSDVVYSKKTDTTQNDLIVLRPTANSDPATRYAAIGLWQTVRPDPSKPGEALADFDTFVYGYASPNSVVPRSGSAQLPVLMFGLETFGTAYTPPSFVQGQGVFDIDFERGVFRTTGEATANSIFDGSDIGLELWDAAGTLNSSANGFSGRFAMGFTGNTRDEQLVGTLEGQFFGPQASQVAGTITGKSAYNTFGGSFISIDASDTLVNPFTVLPGASNVERRFEARYSTFSYTRTEPTGVLTGAPAHSRPLVNGGRILTDPTEINANAGLLTFAASGSIDFVPGTLNAGTWPGFGSADAKPASSDSEFEAYQKVAGQTTDTLRLFRPGATNSALALTYTSFGMWEHLAPVAAGTTTGRTWFVYGAPTLADMIPRSGVGKYEGIMRGNGVNRNNGGEYTLSGKASFEIYFEGRGMSGVFEPIATPVQQATPLTLTPISVSGAIDRDNSFKGAIWTDYTKLGGNYSAVGILETGSWSGQLYGPRGEEAAGLIDFVLHGESGAVVADFSGAFAAKRTSGP